MKLRPLPDRVVVKRSDDDKKVRNGVVLVDTGYIREQASEALKTFVAPLSGIISAAFGPIREPPEKDSSQKVENAE